jgi:hypothetical protein
MNDPSSLHIMLELGKRVSTTTMEPNSPVFPAEIFQMILREFALLKHANILSLLLQFRLVSKAFNQQVTKTICQAGMLRRILNGCAHLALRRAGKAVFTEYISYRLLHDSKTRLQRRYWSRVIHEVVCFIASETKASKGEQTILTKALCALAVENHSMMSRRKDKPPHPEFGTREPFVIRESKLEQDVLAAAAGLGLHDLVEQMLRDHEPAGSRETIFGEPLQCAVRNEDITLVNVLLPKERHYATLLNAAKAAIHVGNQTLLQNILDHRHALPASRAFCACLASDYDSLMADAAFYGHSEILWCLLQRNEREGRHHRSCSVESCAILFYTESGLSFTPERVLMNAVWRGHISIVRSALFVGADAQLYSRQGPVDTPKSLEVAKFAVSNNYETVLRLLLDTIVPSNRLGDHEKGTMREISAQLLIAAYRGYIGVAEALIDHGADVNYHAEEFLGFERSLVPLFNALICNQVDMVQLLVRRGAKLFWKPWWDVSYTIGELMHVYAVEQEFTSLAMFLEQEGVKRLPLDVKLQGLFRDIPNIRLYQSQEDLE